MPLVNCPTCSTQLKIPDGMGGKKARCTKCQNIFTIPAAAAVTAAAPPRPAPAGAVQQPPFQGGPPAHQGGPPPRKTAAPPAGNGNGSQLQTQRPGPRGPGQAPPRRRPAPQEKKGPPILLLSIVGVVLLLAIGGGVWFFFLRGGSENGPGGGPVAKADPTADHKYLPDNVNIIVSMRPAALLSSPALAQLRTDIPKLDEALKDTSKIKKEMGLDPADVSAMTFAHNTKDKGNMKVMPLVIVRTTKEYTSDQMLENMNKLKEKPQPVTEGSHSIYTVGEANSFCAAESKLVLFGPVDEIRKALKRTGTPAFSSELKQAIAGLDFNSTLVVAAETKSVNPMDFMGKGMGVGLDDHGGRGFNDGGPVGKVGIPPVGGPGGFPGGPGGLPGGPGGLPGGAAAMPELAGLEINVATNIDIKAFAVFKDEKTAKEIQDLAKGLPIMAKAFGAKLPPEVSETIEKIQYTVAGPKLTAQVNLETAKISAALKNDPQMLAMLFGKNPGGPGPIGPGPGGAKDTTEDRRGAFTDSNKNIEPGQTVTYRVKSKANADYKLDVKTQVPMAISTVVMVDGKSVVTDIFPAPKTERSFNWKSVGDVTYEVKVKNEGPTKIACDIALAEKEGTGTPPPGPEVVKAQKKPTPLSEVKAVLPSENFIFEFEVQPGKEAQFTIKAVVGNANLSLKATQGGVRLAEDKGDKNSFALKFTPTGPGPVQIEVVSSVAAATPCNIDFKQDAGDAVVLTPAIMKDGPFADNQALLAKSNLVYQFPVQPGPSKFSVLLNLDALLTVKVLQNGVVLAQDAGKKKEFVLNWNATAAGPVQVQIISTDGIPVAAQSKFELGVTEPPPPGTIVKAGPFSDNLTIKPKDKINYQFPVVAGPCTFTIKPDLDAKLQVVVTVDGKPVVQDIDGALKTKFNLNWNAAAPGTATVQITSIDNIQSPSIITFEQPGVVTTPPPPPPPPAGALTVGGSVQGNVPKGSNSTHQVNLEAGKKYTITLNTLTKGYDPYLWLSDPAGNLVAKDDDSGGFPNAKIEHQAQMTGAYTIKCGSYGNSSGGNYLLSVTEAGGANPGPAVGGQITPPFGAIKVIKPNDVFTYSFVPKAGQPYAFSIKPQFDAIMDVKVMQNGLMLASDINGGIRKNFNLNFTPTGTEVTTIQVVSKDNLANKCTIALAEAGGGVPLNPGVDYNKNGKLLNNKAFSHGQLLQAGVTYKISGTATFFLHLEIKDGLQSIQSQSFPGGTGSLTFTPTATKFYQVIIRDAVNQNNGNYTLTISH